MGNKWMMFFLFLALISTAIGQDTTIVKPIKLGFSLLGASYQGELINDNSFLSRFNPGMSFSMEIASPSHFHFQIEAGSSKFTEQLANQNLQENTFIETSFIFGEISVRYRIIGHSRFQPYVGLGSGMFFFRPMSSGGEEIDLSTPTNNINPEWSRIVPHISGKLGAEFWINRQFALNTSYALRVPFTDVLDDQINNEETFKFDFLHILQLGVQFTFVPGPQWNGNVRKQPANQPLKTENLQLSNMISEFQIDAESDTSLISSDTLFAGGDQDTWVYYSISSEVEFSNLLDFYTLDSVDILTVNPGLSFPLTLGRMIRLPIDTGINPSNVPFGFSLFVEQEVVDTDTILYPDLIQINSEGNLGTTGKLEIYSNGSTDSIDEKKQETDLEKTLTEEEEPLEYIYHKVKKNEKLSDIANMYQVDEVKIVELNFLSTEELLKGLILKIPNRIP